jgi:glutamyl-tRNA synthetase
LDTCKGKVKTFSELPAYAGFYFRPEVEYDAEAAQKEFTPENKGRLEKLRTALAAVQPFDHETAGATLASVAKELGVKTGVLVHPTRVACSGKPAGPSLYHLMAILGKDEVLKRLDRVIAQVPSRG